MVVIQVRDNNDPDLATITEASVILKIKTS